MKGVSCTRVFHIVPEDAATMSILLTRERERESQVQVKGLSDKLIDIIVRLCRAVSRYPSLLLCGRMSAKKG